MQFHMPVANNGSNFSEHSRFKQPDHLQEAQYRARKMTALEPSR
eukprot:COSAG02_NODE_26342_length_635_cov_0.865672_1_plen_43_part_10